MSEAAVEHAVADLGDVHLHYATLGPTATPRDDAAATVVLLHGWPQSWYEWRLVMPLLADCRRVIAPDLRGLGDSSCPPDGYDIATLANDIWRLLDEVFACREFAVIGHDWGGPVAFALAATHRDAVSHLAILDVAVPGDGAANISQGGRRWHHAFHQTPSLPEALIRGREALYVDWFYDNYGATPDAIDDDARAEYHRIYGDPDHLHAGFEYYRNIPRAIEINQALLAQGRLTMPVLALGGSGGWGRGEEVIESCRRVATDVSGGVVEDAGHWLPEEQPDVVARHIIELLAR